MFTLEEGIQSFFMFRPSGKSKIQGALEPLSLIEVIAQKEVKRDMMTVKELRVEHPYKHIGRDFYYNAVILFLNEILIKSIRENHAQAALFHFVKEWLIHYDDGGFDPDAHLYFMAHLTTYLGFYPKLKNPENQGFFDLKEGHYTGKSGHPHIVEPPLTGDFTALFDPQNQHEITGKKRRVLLHLLMEYYALHLPDFGELKSLPIIESIMV